MINRKERKKIEMFLMWRNCVRRKLLRSMKEGVVGCCWGRGRHTKFRKQVSSSILRFLMGMILSWRCSDFYRLLVSRLS